MNLSARIRAGEFHQYEDGQSCDDPADVDTDMIADEVAKLEEKYSDLIMQVSKKFPDESRHETAKRYITERENTVSTAQASAS